MTAGSWRNRLDAAHRPSEVLRGEWHGSADHFVEHRAQCVQVGPTVDRVALNLFGGQVLHRADQRAGFGEGGVVEGFRNAEVRQLHPTVWSHQDVCRLDVAMDDAVLMGVAKRLRDLDGNLECIIDGDRPAAIEDRAEVLTLNQLHDDCVGLDRCDRVKDGHNAGVREPCRRLCFATEAGEDRWVFCEVLVEQLDRNAPAEASIGGLPDFGHSTCADALLELVAVAEQRIIHVIAAGR